MRSSQLLKSSARTFVRFFSKSAFNNANSLANKLNSTKKQNDFKLIIGATAGSVALYSAFVLNNDDLILNDSRKKRKKNRRVIILDDDDDEDDEDEDDEDGEDDEEARLEKLEKQRQLNIKNKPPLSMIFNITDFETIARATLLPGAWGYYSTGASDEFSLRENHYAFARIFFRARVGIDVSNCNTKTKILGQEVSAPFYITAFAGSAMAHPDAEKNLIRGAGKNGIVHLVPKQVSFPLDEFMKEAQEDQINFYQIHFYSQKEFEAAGEFFAKVEKEMPTIKGFFVNVDLASIGNREKDSKVRSGIDPEFVEELGVIVNSNTSYFNATWDDLARLRTFTKKPMVLKGVQRKEDCLTAYKLGFNGALLSNHGGRQLDFSMPPIEVLAQSKKYLRENGVKDKDFEFFIDGGIRRGSDIIKALCLGATAVGLGRPFLYAMSTYGEAGVDRAIKMLKGEMIRDMKLLGAASVADLTEEMVDIESLKYKGIVADDRAYNRNYMEMPAPTFRK